MPDHRFPAPSADDPNARLAALESRLGEVQACLEGLRADLVDEVRTRRLVVVDGDGFERLVAQGGGDDGAVVLRADDGSPRSTAVQLFANDPVDGDGARVGVALGESGDIVAVLEVGTGDDEPVLWLRSPDEG